MRDKPVNPEASDVIIAEVERLRAKIAALPRLALSPYRKRSCLCGKRDCKCTREDCWQGWLITVSHEPYSHEVASPCPECRPDWKHPDLRQDLETLEDKQRRVKAEMATERVQEMLGP